jgi:hypothetical protein
LDGLQGLIIGGAIPGENDPPEAIQTFVSIVKLHRTMLPILYRRLRRGELAATGLLVPTGIRRQIDGDVYQGAVVVDRSIIRYESSEWTNVRVLVQPVTRVDLRELHSVSNILPLTYALDRGRETRLRLVVNDGQGSQLQTREAKALVRLGAKVTPSKTRDLTPMPEMAI